MTEAEAVAWSLREGERVAREIAARFAAWFAQREREAAARGLDLDEGAEDGCRAAAKSLCESVYVRAGLPPGRCTLPEWCEWRRRENDRLLDELIQQLDAWFAVHVRGETKH